MSNKNLLKSGIVIFVLTLVTKIMALAKDILIADRFGVSADTDAFLIAFVIPTSLIYILGINLLQGMSSSIFSEAAAKNKQEDISIIFSTVFNSTIIISVIVSIIGIYFMPELLNIVFPNIPETNFALTVKLSQIMFPLLIFIGFTQFFVSVLNAFRKFFFPALLLTLANFITVIGIYYYSDFGIIAAAYSVLVGFATSFMILFYTIITNNVKYRAIINLKIEPVRNFFIKSAPLLFVAVASQIAIAAEKSVALGLDIGAVSVLSYAGKINEISVGLFVAPLMTVLLPEFARDKALRDMSTLKKRIRIGAEILTSVVVFWTAFLLVYRFEIVQILFERGEFTSENTLLTSDLLLIYTAGFLFQAAYLLLVYIYLGLQKTKSLSAIASFSYLFYTLLIIYLPNIYGVYGLAIANVIFGILYTCILLFYLKFRHIKFNLLKSLNKIFKIIFIGLISYTLLFYTREFFITISSSFSVKILLMSTFFILALGVHIVTLKKFNIFDLFKLFRIR